jgi:hypothetical protein
MYHITKYPIHPNYLINNNYYPEQQHVFKLEESVVHLLKYNSFRVDVSNLEIKYSAYKNKMKELEKAEGIKKNKILSDLKCYAISVEKEYILLTRDNSYEQDNLRWLYDNDFNDNDNDI